jgi:hypothetical protein
VNRISLSEHKQFYNYWFHWRVLSLASICQISVVPTCILWHANPVRKASIIYQPPLIGKMEAEKSDRWPVRCYYGSHTAHCTKLPWHSTRIYLNIKLQQSEISASNLDSVGRNGVKEWGLLLVMAGQDSCFPCSYRFTASERGRSSLLIAWKGGMLCQIIRARNAA